MQTVSSGSSAQGGEILCDRAVGVRQYQMVERSQVDAGGFLERMPLQGAEEAVVGAQGAFVLTV
ncbi:MAG: hypothetical protein LBQ73_04920 [Tannerellaceae bacterium]|nr:hypothetical protein [Tannerellaceae bacterium]